MTELIGKIVSWPTLLFLGVVFVLYGFAPWFTLRLTVLLYPRDHSRRRELIAELYTVPRLHRPFWVMEQLETALAEGLTVRLLRAVRDRYRRLSLPHFAAAGWMGYLAVQAAWMGRAVPMGVETLVISTALFIGCSLATSSTMSTPFMRRVLSYGAALVGVCGGAAILMSVLSRPADPVSESLPETLPPFTWAFGAFVSFGCALVFWNGTAMRLQLGLEVEEPRREPWLATVIGRRR